MINQTQDEDGSYHPTDYNKFDDMSLSISDEADKFMTFAEKYGVSFMLIAYHKDAARSTTMWHVPEGSYAGLISHFAEFIRKGTNGAYSLALVPADLPENSSEDV